MNKFDDNLTLIVTCYNSAEYIENTIYSIMKNCRKISEIIFIDDCSTDDTRNIIEKNLNNLPFSRIIKTEKNSGGPAIPRNIGIKNSQNSYIMFLDADDSLCCQVEYMFDIFMKEKLDAISFSYNYSPSEASTIVGNINVTRFTLKQQIRKNRFKLSGSIYSKNALISVGYFNEEKQYVAVEDFIMFSMLILKGFNVGLCNMPCVRYLPTENSISRSKIKMIGKNWRSQFYLLNLIGQASMINRILNLSFYILSSIISYYKIKLFMILNKIMGVI